MRIVVNSSEDVVSCCRGKDAQSTLLMCWQSSPCCVGSSVDSLKEICSDTVAELGQWPERPVTMQRRDQEQVQQWQKHEATTDADADAVTDTGNR